MQATANHLLHTGIECPWPEPSMQVVGRFFFAQPGFPGVGQ